MSKLHSQYLGMTLRNPMIVSSSGLTTTLQKLIRLQESGAGAVVLKSVFEEQVYHETSQLETYNSYPEAADYLQNYLREDYLGEYLTLIKDAKKQLSIPVMGSICCVSKGSWIDFAKRMEDAGADGLELNIFLLPLALNETGEEIEERYLTLVQSVRDAVNLPIAVKIGSRFTNLLRMIERIYRTGVQGVVMFNRFYEPDININSLQVTEAGIFSDSSELRNSLRWIAMGSAYTPQLDIAASTGVLTGQDAVKVLLAGATAFEVCTTVYRNGLDVISQITDFIRAWMDEHGFDSIDQVVGKVNYKRIENPLAYERAQFMKYFSGHE